MADPRHKKPRSHWTELGSSGLKQSGGLIDEEFLPMLRGDQGRRFLKEMADNSPIAGAILFAFEKIILNLEWRVDPAEETGDDDAALDVAVFVDSCRNDMEQSWNSTLSEICTMFTYGWSLTETVFKQRLGPTADPTKRSKFTDGRIGWRKWAPRAQDTLLQWDIDDVTGDVLGMTQMDPYAGRRGAVTIPLTKALLFKTTSTKTNPEGRSLLRNGAPSWYLQKRMQEIEAVGVERDLAGLPVAWVPQEWLMDTATASEVAALASVKDIVKNVKRNEQEGIVLPAVIDAENARMVKTVDFQLLNSGGARNFDTDKIITRYEQRIAMSVLMDFLLLGHEAVGSKALSVSKIDLWTMAVDAIACSIAETVTTNAIPQLCTLNGIERSMAPSLTYGDVNPTDVAGIAAAVHQLAAVGAITPDDNLEGVLRDILGLPPQEEANRGDLGLPEEPEPEPEPAPEPEPGPEP
jgi:hypothetical protein